MLHGENPRQKARLDPIAPLIRSVGGAEPWITTREDFAAAIQRDYEKYGKLVKEIGARLD